ncbi:hypothetical protein [Tychonema sp. BBK16]|uniref:hypothetical protein n=1 Tax=Tychonema sp. BBK16 TaxID=2699888 RepID=UPI001F183B54|nr:hypothetical protein [Tychonema sp. BBK16]MCF6373897.1 hypothetical protein [Tychonema sp. BBK16]
MKYDVCCGKKSPFTKSLFLFLIAGFTGIIALQPEESAVMGQQPVCPKGDVADFPAPPLSQNQKSVPSLWLAQKQFGGQLLDRWFIDSNSTNSWVVLVVNRQLWSGLDYVARYQFVNRFGVAASEYGYNVRVCNRQGAGLAVYSCNRDRLSCRIDLESVSNPGIQRRPKLF